MKKCCNLEDIYKQIARIHYIHLQEDIDIGFIPEDTSTPENESGKHVLTPTMIDRTELQTIILIALTSRGFLYLAFPITPCALTFPSLETSCKPLRRTEYYG